MLQETVEELRPAASAGAASSDRPTLTERERLILKGIADGKTGPQIADKLCLSPETVKWYRKKLLFKFDAANSAELVSRAKACGYL